MVGAIHHKFRKSNPLWFRLSYSKRNLHQTSLQSQSHLFVMRQTQTFQEPLSLQKRYNIINSHTPICKTNPFEDRMWRLENQHSATKGAPNIPSQPLANQLEETNIGVLQSPMPLVDTPMTNRRGPKKISTAKVADKIIVQLSIETSNSYIEKEKLLGLLLVCFPSLAKKILEVG